MNTFLIIIGFAIVGGIISAIVATSNKKKKMRLSGFDPKQAIKTGKYTTGHPNMDKPEDQTEIIIKDQLLNIFSISQNGNPVLKATIPAVSVKNVIIEDASTMERRVTVGRLVMIGIFAFAAKKKKKSELTYLVIEWNDGRFDHATIFEFSGREAIASGNTARNQIIRKIN